MGDSLWARTYGGGDNDAGKCIHQTNDDGYIIAGETWSFGAGLSNIYLLRTDSLGLLAVKEEPLPDVSRDWKVVIKIDPLIVLSYTNRPEGFRASVFNALGRKVDELTTSNSSGSLMFGQSYPSGVYFVRVADNPSKTERVIIVH